MKTLSIIGLFEKLSINDSQHTIIEYQHLNVVLSFAFFYSYSECQHAVCRFAERH
jgi:hypothetical protein